jgi:hypothetical protein
MFNIKYAKALLWVAFGTLVAGAIIFLTGKNGLAPIVMATAVVGYLIYAIGKSGLPGSEPKEEQAQREQEHNAEKEQKEHEKSLQRDSAQSLP